MANPSTFRLVTSVWSYYVFTQGTNVGLNMRLSNGSLVDLKYEVPRRVMIISRTEEPLQATELQVTKKEDSLTLCEVRVFGGKFYTRQNAMMETV